MVTTLRELMDRFGGLDGTVLDESGRAHPISLAPLAGADTRGPAPGSYQAAGARPAMGAGATPLTAHPGPREMPARTMSAWRPKS